MNLTPEELATVLAALRFYQESGQSFSDVREGGIDDIATGCGALTPLNGAEIDKLCEKLNAGPKTHILLVAESKPRCPECQTELRCVAVDEFTGVPFTVESGEIYEVETGWGHYESSWPTHIFCPNDACEFKSKPDQIKWVEAK